MIRSEAMKNVGKMVSYVVGGITYFGHIVIATSEKTMVHWIGLNQTLEVKYMERLKLVSPELAKVITENQSESVHF